MNEPEHNEAEHNDPKHAPAGRKPEFIAYQVKDSRDGKGHWSPIGAVWPHRDGQGYDVQLEAVPVDGRITLRALREERLGQVSAAPEQAPEQTPDRRPPRERGR
ncbi:MAG: hypothetical protein KDH88_19755 [Chromatiales bacterium]|nr:hypothetical protein [Chromatiales bacterium]